MVPGRRRPQHHPPQQRHLKHPRDHLARSSPIGGTRGAVLETSVVQPARPTASRINWALLFVVIGGVLGLAYVFTTRSIGGTDEPQQITRVALIDQGWFIPPTRDRVATAPPDYTLDKCFDTELYNRVLSSVGSPQVGWSEQFHNPPCLTTSPSPPRRRTSLPSSYPLTTPSDSSGVRFTGAPGSSAPGASRGEHQLRDLVALAHRAPERMGGTLIPVSALRSFSSAAGPSSSAAVGGAARGLRRGAALRSRA